LGFDTYLLERGKPCHHTCTCTLRPRLSYMYMSICYCVVTVQGCFQLGKALCIPPTAVLGGLVIITSYMASPAVVMVPGTNWSEPALVWLCINMPTGSTKSALYQYLHGIITQVRTACGYASRDPAWLLGDASCEKMGDLMAANGGRLLGLYDELSTFLTQLNLYRGKGLTLTHELAVFLQLFNGHSWTRTTGTWENSVCRHTSVKAS